MTPDFSILADGADITARIRDRLVSLNVSDEPGMTADECVIRIDDRGGIVEIPRRGVRLEVALGYRETGLTAMGTFVVEAVAGEGPDQAMTISAKSADLTGAIRAPRTRDWTGVTLGQIVTSIAGRHGLTPVIQAGLAAHAYTHVAQTAESDLHLLARLASDIGALAKVASGRLILTPEGEAATASGAALAPIGLARHEFQSWRWRVGERADYNSCIAWWHDHAAAERKPETAGAGEPVFEIRKTFTSAEAALRAALARLEALKRGRLSLSGELARANFAVAAEMPLAIAGLRPGIDGRWIATRVQHRLDGPLTTAFDAETPAEGGADAAAAEDG